MKIEIIRNNEAVASAEKEKEVYLVFQEEYAEGDRIVFTPERKGFERKAVCHEYSVWAEA